MPRDRSLPAYGLADGRAWWQAAGLSLSEKVAVYWQSSADTVTLVGYYDTVSAANTAAAGAELAGPRRPRVVINWWHTDITHKTAGPRQHPDASVALPDWIDAEPAS